MSVSEPLTVIAKADISSTGLMVIVPIFTSLTPAEISAPETSTILPTELLDKELFIDMAPMVALVS